ncbi:MAG: glycosyltransferase [Gammaproteobacteria bacterium]
MPKPRTGKFSIISPLFRNGIGHHGDGGITPVIVNLANKLATWGIQVDLLVFPPKGLSPKLDGLHTNINIVNLKSSHKITTLLSLLRYLKKEQPNALLSAGHRANLIAAWAKRISKYKTKLIISVHSTITPESNVLKPFKRWRRNSSIRWFYPWADQIVGVSRGVADDLIENIHIPSEQVSVIYNPVYTHEFLKQAERPISHPWLISDSSVPVILAAGRLVPQKDFTTLITAFAKVREKMNCKLIIMGEGEDRAKLEKMVEAYHLQKDIDLPGFIATPLAYMGKASLFTLSSAWEGFGNVLIEALAIGLPVVSTDCPSGPKEILDDGRYGSLVNVGNADQLASAIIDALKNPPEKSILQQRAEMFGIDQSSEAYLKLSGIAV